MAINKVVYGNDTLIDLTDTTATASDVASGKSFYGANGVLTTGSGDYVDDVQVNGNSVVSDHVANIVTESAYNSSTNKIATKSDIPTKTSELTNDSGFITKSVNNLNNYELKTDTGHSIELSLNTTTYVMTLNLKNSAGTTISTDTIDLPLESVVVNGSYDSTNKKIILTLESGSTIDIPVGDLVSGLQSEITSSNKLSSDLVDDTNKTHKFVTSSEKTTWNGKQNAITSTNKLDYSLLSNTPTIPTVNNATLTIQKNGSTVKTFTANASSNVTANITVPTKTSELTNDSGFLTSHQSLSNYVTLNSEQTITGKKNFNNLNMNNVNSATYSKSSTGNISPDANALSNPPWNKDLWHDHFAFMRYHSIYSQETTTDGTTWTTDSKTLNNLFSQKENVITTILTASELAYRFTFKNSTFAYSSLSWFEISVAYTNPFSNFKVLIEHSSDNSTWSTCHESTISYNSKPFFLPNGYTIQTDGYTRFTFTKTTNLTTGTVGLTCIKGLCTRKGNQGLGLEFEYPYDWDTSANLLPISNNSKSLGSSSKKWNTVYATTFDGNATSSTKATQDSDGNAINTTYAKQSTLSNVATTGSYNDLSNKPTIPTKTSQLTNDSGYTTNTGTITKVQANGTDVASSGTANIPAATTSSYGVTQLSNSTSSTSTSLAATPSAVKSAYDLANTANTTSGTNSINIGDLTALTTTDKSDLVSAINEIITKLNDLDGKKIWTNASPTSSFASQTITLSESLSNYNYYEIVFRQNKNATNERYFTTGKIPVGHGTILNAYGTSYRPTGTSVSGNTISFESASPDNNYAIPIYVKGYK